ncbi:hypothetical protein ACQPU1_03495 [Clostridium paraputrificum]|uniref:hypothetical protein n=1 Tax=Clostridium TaxID=1485 RepID=UPI003D33C3A8
MRNDIPTINKKLILRRKKRRNKRLVTIISIIFLLLTSGYIIRKIYIQTRCRDLEYAVDYYLTSGNEANGLLLVKTITLVFSDNDTAVIEAYGLNKSEPHASTAIKGYFKKDSFNSWTLENSYPIEN